MASPLFLLAPPRSYTSLMNAMIGQHPQTFGLPELNLFNVEQLKDLWRKVSDEIGDDSNRRQGLLRAVAEIYAGEQSVATINMAMHWAAARQEMPTGESTGSWWPRLTPLSLLRKALLTQFR